MDSTCIIDDHFKWTYLMRYQKLGGTGFEVSAVSYGGVVSSQHFDKAVIPGDGQGMSSSTTT